MQTLSGDVESESAVALGARLMEAYGDPQGRGMGEVTEEGTRPRDQVDPNSSTYFQFIFNKFSIYFQGL